MAVAKPRSPFGVEHVARHLAGRFCAHVLGVWPRRRALVSASGRPERQEDDKDRGNAEAQICI